MLLVGRVLAFCAFSKKKREKGIAMEGNGKKNSVLQVLYWPSFPISGSREEKGLKSLR